MKNWEKRFKRAFAGLDLEYPGEVRDAKEFIRTQVIEKLIEDAVNGAHNTDLLREELTAKWLTGRKL